MPTKRKPDDIVNLKVRFSEAMRARLAQEAKRNNRSLNGEIVYRLGTTLGPEGLALASQFEELQAEAAKLLREVVQRVIAERQKGKGHA